MPGKKGRKPIYDTKNLEIGNRLQLFGKAKRFKDQYLYTFNGRHLRRSDFILVEENDKIFVERIA